MKILNSHLHPNVELWMQDYQHINNTSQKKKKKKRQVENSERKKKHENTKITCTCSDNVIKCSFKLKSKALGGTVHTGYAPQLLGNTNILKKGLSPKKKDRNVFVKHYAPNYMLVDTKCES